MGMDRKIEKKKGIKAKHILYVSIAIIAILLLIKVIKDSKTSTYRAETDKISISEVNEGSFKAYITIIGRVEPIPHIFLNV